MAHAATSRWGKREQKMMVRVGFEPTPGFPDEKTCFAGKLSLESHALDRSAIAPMNTEGQGFFKSYT